MSDQRRGLQSPAVTKFKGINRFTNIVATSPEYAIDLLNVVCSLSGGLLKLRVPRDIATATIGGFCYGVSDFQQGDGTRQIVAGFGSKIIVYEWNGAAYDAVEVDDNPLNAHPWSMRESNNLLFMANGFRMVKWDGTNIRKWGIQRPGNGSTSTLDTAAAGTMNFSTGRRYKYAWKNSETGHESSVSDASPSTGALVNKAIVVTTAAGVVAELAADPQIDTIVWYATIDGGVEYLYHSEVLIVNPLAAQTLADTLTDSELDTTTVGSLINDPPPVGRYLTEWGGRIYIANLDGAPQDMVYSGYEQILVGRPEESFPPNNRLRLSIGADHLRGVGVVQAGVVAGSKSNELFMLRGEVEDFVTGEPVAYSALLEKLPFDTGMGSHFSIVQTPTGLKFFTADATIDSYDGTGSPQTISTAIYNVLRSITKGYEEAATGCFFNYLDKDWYILGLPTNGAPRPNKIVVVDLAEDSEESAGIFLFDIGEFDQIVSVEDNDGRPMIVVVQDGMLKSMYVVTDEVNGLPETEDITDEVLNAYYYPGYFGNDQPQMMKQFRQVTVVGTGDVALRIKLVDDRKYTFRNPEEIVVNAEQLSVNPGVYSINRKSRRCSPGIVFAATDKNIAVNSLWLSYINTAER